MNKIVSHIINKEYDSANDALNEQMENIIQHKLQEMRQSIDLTETLIKMKHVKKSGKKRAYSIRKGNEFVRITKEPDGAVITSSRRGHWEEPDGGDKRNHKRITSNARRQIAGAVEAARAQLDEHEMRRSIDLTEVSKEKLGRYIKQANYDGGMANFRHGISTGKRPRGDKDNKNYQAYKAFKRPTVKDELEPSPVLAGRSPT